MRPHYRRILGIPLPEWAPVEMGFPIILVTRTTSHTLIIEAE